MTKQLTIGGILVAITLLIVWVGSARADEYSGPPPAGWEGGFKNKLVVCNTNEQVKSIAKAGATEYAPMLAKLEELYKLSDAKGEHTCMLAPVAEVVVGESEEIGFIIDSLGVRSKAWAVHLGNMYGDWWALFATHPKGDPA